MDTKNVTIPKIVACLPIRLCDCYNSGTAKHLYFYSDLLLSETTNLPKCILCPQVVSVIPKALIQKNGDVNYRIFLAHVLCDNIIHSADIKTYFSAALQSSVVSELACQKYSFDNKLTVNGLHLCREKIKELKPNDPELNAVILDLPNIH